MERFQKNSSGQITISTWTVVKIISIILGIWLLWFLRDIFAILLAALLLASLIEPFAGWLHNKKLPRGAAVLVVYVVLLSITTSILILLVPVIVDQVSQLLSNFGDIYRSLIDSFAHFKILSAEYGLEKNFLATIDSLQQGVAYSARSLFSTFSNSISGIVGLLVVLVLTFYLIVEEASARKFLKGIIPIEYQPYTFRLLEKIQKKLGCWLRAQLILSLIISFFVYIGLSFLGVEYALLLAVIAGLFEFVPYIGPVLAALPAALIGFTDSPFKGLLVILLYVVIQQIENHILVPKVMQKVTGLNPVISIIALLVGVKLGGMVGVLLAIPVAVIAMVIIEDLFNQNSH